MTLPSPAGFAGPFSGTLPTSGPTLRGRTPVTTAPAAGPHPGGGSRFP